MGPYAGLIAGIARIVLGTLFLASGVAKITQFEVLPIGPAQGLQVFAYVLQRHALFPSVMAWPVAVGVVGAEVLVGLWLLSHRRGSTAGRCALVLLLMFTLYLAIAIWHQGKAACNCFGTLQPTSVGWAIARNTGLMLLSAVAGWPAILRGRTSVPVHGTG